jgi:XTP/dITP diphosphohydrolase
MGDIDTTAGTGTGAGAASPLDALAELIAIVERLRDPVSGCPWDLEQTHESLIPYVL